MDHEEEKKDMGAASAIDAARPQAQAGTTSSPRPAGRGLPGGFSGMRA
jgi:hypothetical protein